MLQLMPFDVDGWLRERGAIDVIYSATGIAVFSTSSLSASFASAIQAAKVMPLAGQARGIGREMAGQMA